MIGSFSIWHWLIVLIIVLVLFGGKNRISQIMTDLGLGLKNFRKSLHEESNADTTESDAHNKNKNKTHNRSVE